MPTLRSGNAGQKPPVYAGIAGRIADHACVIHRLTRRVAVHRAKTKSLDLCRPGIQAASSRVVSTARRRVVVAERSIVAKIRAARRLSERIVEVPIELNAAGERRAAVESVSQVYQF